MFKKFVILIVALLFLYACGVKIYPISSPDVELDTKNNILSAMKDNIRVTVEVVPQTYSFYGMEDNFVIFYVKVENRNDRELTILPDDFLLLDDKSHQVSVMKVEDVAKIVEQNLFYLIPYPYIGYYSESLNYYEGRYLYNPSAPHIYPVSPREIYLDALPWGKIFPKAHIKGKIYFKKKISEAKSLALKAIKNNSDYLMEFRFQIK